MCTRMSQSTALSIWIRKLPESICLPAQNLPVFRQLYSVSLCCPAAISVTGTNTTPGQYHKRRNGSVAYYLSILPFYNRVLPVSAEKGQYQLHAAFQAIPCLI